MPVGKCDFCGYELEVRSGQYLLDVQHGVVLGCDEGRGEDGGGVARCKKRTNQFVVGESRLFMFVFFFLFFLKLGDCLLK